MSCPRQANGGDKDRQTTWKGWIQGRTWPAVPKVLIEWMIVDTIIVCSDLAWKAGRDSVTGDVGNDDVEVIMEWINLEQLLEPTQLSYAPAPRSLRRRATSISKHEAMAEQRGRAVAMDGHASTASHSLARTQFISFSPQTPTNTVSGCLIAVLRPCCNISI